MVVVVVVVVLQKVHPKLAIFQHRPKTEIEVLALGSKDVNSSNAARNIGVIFDEKIKFEKQIAAICKTSFFHIDKLPVFPEDFYLMKLSKYLFMRLLRVDLIIVIHYYMGYRRTLSKSFNESKTALHDLS